MMEKYKYLFEGFYLNGERNGKGTEYATRYKLIIFDGEYYNGRRWNGKIYNYEGNIISELKNGKGFIKTYRDGILDFEEGIFNGEINGMEYTKNMIIMAI